MSARRATRMPAGEVAWVNPGCRLPAPVLARLDAIARRRGLSRQATLAALIQEADEGTDEPRAEDVLREASDDLRARAEALAKARAAGTLASMVRGAITDAFRGNGARKGEDHG